MAQTGILKSSLAKKYAMAATGLFLCLFLVGHLAGNLQLFTAGADGGRQFNEYAKFMTTFPAVKILSYLTYFAVLFHLADGIVLSLQNRKARPVRYAMERPSTNAGWSSRNMMVLGTIVLVFLVTHMQNFWWQMHFGDVPMQALEDGTMVRDLYSVVAAFFNPEMNSWALPAIGLYLLGQFALGFHLWHGFSSGFQSVGLRHPRYSAIIGFVGKAFSVVVPLLFSAIVVFMYFTQA
ncbi:MAG: succinate dehydrogenase cytochrome b subunit [Flavobacteriales bacterium]|nr:succinate dehydrogenase cytochrome b subunit [Flavobacteriales bacterium]